MASNQKACPNCGSKLRQLRAELNSKIFFTKHSSGKEEETKKTAVTIDEDERPEIDGETPRTELVEMNVSSSRDPEQETHTKHKHAQTYLTPVEVRKHMRALIQNEHDVLAYLLGSGLAAAADDQDVSEMFFFDCVAVPPSKFRPISQLNDQKFENAQTGQLSKLIANNLVLKEVLGTFVDSDPGKTNGHTDSSENIIDKISSNLGFFNFKLKKNL